MNGNEIRALREQARLTQKAVADKIGISPQSYQRFEHCGEKEAKINPSYYAALADLYSITRDSFIPRSTVPSGGNTATADNGSVAVAAGGNVSNMVSQKRKLTPLEEQVLPLKDLYDPNELLYREYAAKLLEFQRIHKR